MKCLAIEFIYFYPRPSIIYRLLLNLNYAHFKIYPALSPCEACVRYNLYTHICTTSAVTWLTTLTTIQWAIIKLRNKSYWILGRKYKSKKWVSRYLFYLNIYRKLLISFGYSVLQRGLQNFLKSIINLVSSNALDQIFMSIGSYIFHK